ncbi:MAG: hypothetical protein U1C49_02490 [Candidatus Andersenbacteria bacterium]|nr:hypothetical protein [bacterium]MDZ4225696.1 hypothetical protein [Candidatus Andersenbacteria bacterium]
MSLKTFSAWTIFLTALVVTVSITYSITASAVRVALSNKQPIVEAALPAILAAIAVLLGSFLLSYLPARKRWLAASLLLTIVIPLALSGFWFSNHALGISDWDYYFSYHTYVRNIVLNYHQIPLWNPYTCGGTAGLADPEFPLITPTFLFFELPFGIETGLRLSIYFSCIIGALGLLALGKRLSFSPHAALLTSIGVTLSSVNLLEIVEGHPNIFAAMYLPWVFWAWHKAYANFQFSIFNFQSNPNNLISQNPDTDLVKIKKSIGLKINNWKFNGNWKLEIGNSAYYSLIAGIFLALMFYQGGVYLLMYTVIVFLFLIIAAKKHVRAITITAVSGLFALGLAAFKLLPALYWLRQFQDTTYAGSAYTLPQLHRILLGRYLRTPLELIPNQASGWHEYGAYIGPIILALAAVSLLLVFKNRLIRYLWIAIILAISISSSGPLLKPFFDQAPWFPRSNISRFILIAVIGLSLSAGFGLDSLTKKIRSRRIVRAILLGLVTLDLATLSYPLSRQAFVLPDVSPAPAPAPAPIAFTGKTYNHEYREENFTRSYVAAKQNYGTLNYCSVLSPQVAVSQIEDANHDYLKTSDPNGQLTLVSWSPNSVIVKAILTQPADVFINTNYAIGWFVNNQPTKEIGNRVGVVAPAGHNDFTFTYRAPGYVTGLIITIATIAISIIFLATNPSLIPRQPR